jgi:hypothetical protein
MSPRSVSLDDPVLRVRLRPRTRLAVCFGTLLLAVAGPAAAALVEYAVRAQSTAGVNVDGDQVPVSLPFSHTANSGGSHASASYTPATPPNFASVAVKADTAWPAGGTNLHPGENHLSGASIIVSDSFIPVRPAGSSDYLVDLSFSIGLSGFLAQSNGTAFWQTEARLTGIAYRDSTFTVVSPHISLYAYGRNPGVPGTSLPVTLSSAVPSPSTNLTQNFVYGEPVQLFWSVMVWANGSGAGENAGYATADLSQTALWLGITGRDQQGQIIEGLTFQSESGANWGVPPVVIPLPAGIWLLLTGLGALVTRRVASRGSLRHQ